jgi:elongation of very long chain fatty acids protein 4
MAKIVWVFYVSKIWEFVDTMIMIVKKNYRQISFLHVYHHSTIFGIWWYVTLIAPNGEAYFSAAFNSLIHVIMYGYYFCSAIGIKQVSLIKRYITTCQMFQFSCMFVQATYNIINAFILRPNPAEHYSTQLSVILWFYMISMLALFYNFFVQDQKRAKLAKLAKKEAKLE